MHLPLNPPVQRCFANQFFLRHEDGTFEEIKPPLSQDDTIDIKDFAAWGLGLQARYPTARRLEIRPSYASAGPSEYVTPEIQSGAANT